MEEDSSGTESNAIKNDTNPFYDSSENDKSMTYADAKFNPFDDGDDSSSSGSESRPHFTRDSSGRSVSYIIYIVF